MIDKEVLYGRGTVDMKGAIAAFICAAVDLLHKGKLNGSLSLLLTGDEEGDAIDGTEKAFERLKEIGHIPDFCLVGEPTSEEEVGDTIKIGSRGSLTGDIVVTGLQGHVALPHKARNPVSELVGLLNELKIYEWDNGNAHFDPTNLEIISVDVGNMAVNIIPAQATARFNIRYNDLHSRESITEIVEGLASQHAKDYSFTVNGGSSLFLTNAPELVKRIAHSVEKTSGNGVNINTSGGTSDARFIHHYCPVVELGLLNATAHQIDENVSIEDLHKLQKIYGQILEDYYAS